MHAPRLRWCSRARWCASAATSRRADVAAAKAAGYDDGQIVEIILHVALNTLTNYVNSALATDIDFPAVTPRPGAMASLSR
jgi:hypothetical protein